MPTTTLWNLPETRPLGTMGLEGELIPEGKGEGVSVHTGCPSVPGRVGISSAGTQKPSSERRRP